MQFALKDDVDFVVGQGPGKKQLLQDM
jgi:hypothetical protein